MIINGFDYSFEDEFVSKFCYDSSVNEIVVQFDGYYENSNYIEDKCCLIIKNWQSASSKLHGEDRFSSLERHLGIFNMVLSIEIVQNELEITLNTLDDRYLELYFDNAEIELTKRK